MADKEGMERKVYLLPTELVERIKAYQSDQKIVSEVEAARRLLDMALQMRDNVRTLLDKMRSRFEFEEDVRVIARDVLSTHTLVKQLAYDENSVVFVLANGSQGRMNATGKTSARDTGNHSWEAYPEDDMPF